MATTATTLTEYIPNEPSWFADYCNQQSNNLLTNELADILRTYSTEE